MLVFFALSYVADSTIPFTENASWAVSWAAVLQPADLLFVLAFLMLVLADEGRLPVDNLAGKSEIAMIGHSKPEHHFNHGFDVNSGRSWLLK